MYLTYVWVHAELILYLVSNSNSVSKQNVFLKQLFFFILTYYYVAPTDLSQIFEAYFKLWHESWWG